MGIERFVALYAACGGETPATDADVYIAAFGGGTLERAFVLAEELRDNIAGIRVELNLGGGSFKSQMKRADKSGAEFALILGEQELADGCIGIKPLRSSEEQTSVALDALVETLVRNLR
jgi:histidyl-tRNA synthetase